VVSTCVVLSVVLLVTLVLTMNLYVCNKCNDIRFCHVSYKHKAITTTTTTTSTTDSHEFELLNVIRRSQFVVAIGDSDEVYGLHSRHVCMPSTVVWSSFRKHGVKLATTGWLRRTASTTIFLNVSHSDRRSAIPVLT